MTLQQCNQNYVTPETQRSVNGVWRQHIDMIYEGIFETLTRSPTVITL